MFYVNVTTMQIKIKYNGKVFFFPQYSLFSVSDLLGMYISA